MSSAHVTTKSLTMRENFTACLTDKLAITLLFDYLSLCYLGLFVSLLDVLSDTSSLNYYILTWGSIRHGCIGGRFNFVTWRRKLRLSRRNSLAFQSVWLDFLARSLCLLVMTTGRDTLIISNETWFLWSLRSPQWLFLFFLHLLLLKRMLSDWLLILCDSLITILMVQLRALIVLILVIAFPRIIFIPFIYLFFCFRSSRCIFILVIHFRLIWFIHGFKRLFKIRFFKFLYLLPILRLNIDILSWLHNLESDCAAKLCGPFIQVREAQRCYTATWEHSLPCLNGNVAILRLIHTPLLVYNLCKKLVHLIKDTIQVTLLNLPFLVLLFRTASRLGFSGALLLILWVNWCIDGSIGWKLLMHDSFRETWLSLQIGLLV